MFTCTAQGRCVGSCTILKSELKTKTNQDGTVGKIYLVNVEDFDRTRIYLVQHGRSDRLSPEFVTLKALGAGHCVQFV